MTVKTGFQAQGGRCQGRAGPAAEGERVEKGLGTGDAVKRRQRNLLLDETKISKGRFVSF